MSPDLITESGWTFGYVGLYAAARERFLRALEIEPRFALALYNVGWTYEGEGRLEEAIDAYRRAYEMSGGIKWIQAFLAGALVRHGQHDEATAIRDEIHAAVKAGLSDEIPLAFAEDALGNGEAALDALEAAYEKRVPFVSTLNNAGWLRFDTVRSHPRFRSLLEQIGLPIVDLDAERVKLEQRLAGSAPPD